MLLKSFIIKILYCNLSFIIVDGFPTLRSFVKGKDIVISKILINDLFKFSHNMEDSTPNFVAFQNAKGICVLASHSDFSPTWQLTHNGLNWFDKLPHTLFVKIVYSRKFLLQTCYGCSPYFYVESCNCNMRFCSSFFVTLLFFMLIC